MMTDRPCDMDVCKPGAVSQVKEVSLLFTGDLCLGLRVREKIKENGIDFPYFHVRELLSGSDLVITNLECVISENPPSGSRAERMAIEVDQAEGLKRSGVDIACLANNHVMDMGVEGLRSTKKALEAWGINHYGAGNTEDEAARPLLITQEHIKIAFLGACDFSPHQARSGAGVSALDERKLLKRVADIKSEVDVVVVTLHADVEFSDQPGRWRVDFARALVDAGATLVVQHHPHVIQGVENYKSGVIAYSLGNFVFSVNDNAYQNIWTGTDEGVVLRVDLKVDDRVEVEWSAIPVKIDEEHRPHVLSGAHAVAVLNRLQRLSRAIGLESTGCDAWKNRAVAELRARIADAYWACRKLKFGKACRELACLTRKEYRRLIAGIVGF